MSVKSETVSIRLSIEEKDAIKEIAKEKDMTVSKLLHKLVIKLIEEEVNK